MAGRVAGKQARRLTRPGKWGYAFVAPFMIMFAAVVLGPLGYAFYLSLFSQHLIGGTVFVGLGNYADAVTDPAFLSGVARVASFFLIQVPVMLVLAVVFALLLDSGRLLAPRFLRLALFVPYAVPSVVAAIMWGSLYSPRIGALGQVLHGIGLPVPGFFTPGGILPSIANIVTWEFTGYNMIIFYAALRALPPEVYEAAAIDGAGPLTIALRIKLPRLRPALVLTLIFSVIGSFQLFNEPNVLASAAGPAAISSSWTPNLYAYTLAFSDNQVNYAAAISFLLGFLIFMGTLIVMLAASSVRRRAAA
jgi:multiple sugar transport system permease protein